MRPSYARIIALLASDSTVDAVLAAALLAAADAAAPAVMIRIGGAK
jgi:hypothetical protein